MEETPYKPKSVGKIFQTEGKTTVKPKGEDQHGGTELCVGGAVVRSSLELLGYRE